jgi:hypothetical protein
LISSKNKTYILNGSYYTISTRFEHFKLEENKKMNYKTNDFTWKIYTRKLLLWAFPDIFSGNKKEIGLRVPIPNKQMNLKSEKWLIICINLINIYYLFRKLLFKIFIRFSQYTISISIAVLLTFIFHDCKRCRYCIAYEKEFSNCLN